MALSGSTTGQQTEYAFDIRGLTKTYMRDTERLTVLDNLSIKMDSGSILVIQGASGSGKSTLLNIIGGIDKYDSGEVIVDGINVNTLNEEAKGVFRSQKLGFVFQQHLLLGDFDLVENVALPMLIQRRPRKQAYDQARQLLASVGLDHRLNHYPGQISGGESQRVSIARSLAGGAGLILADEPTGNLDTRTSGQIVDLLWNLQAEHRFSLVVVTHDDNLAERADRRVFLRNGVIQ